MSTRKVMNLLDASTGLMECKVCGYQHWANYKEGGRFYRGSWQCPNGCKLPNKKIISKTEWEMMRSEHF